MCCTALCEGMFVSDWCVCVVCIVRLSMYLGDVMCDQCIGSDGVVVMASNGE